MEVHAETQMKRDGLDLSKLTYRGRDVFFSATNERLQNRVSNLSNESHVLDAIIDNIRAESVFWDVGACLGIHTFTAAKHLESGRVLAFEPMPRNRDVLIKNVNLNCLSNVFISGSALANESGTEEFAIRESEEPGYGRHGFDVEGYDKIKTVEVSKVRGDQLDRLTPNVVKVDVEGAEGPALEGMMDTISSDECHTIIVETHEPNPVQPSHLDFGYTTDDLKQLLRDAGFTVGHLEKEWHIIGKK